MSIAKITSLDPKKTGSLQKKQIEIEKKLDSSGLNSWHKNHKILVQHLRHYDWKCPDWIEPEAYPENPSAFCDWQWKWEFVRRLPAYRYAYLYYQNKKWAQSWIQNGLNMGEYLDPRMPINNIPDDPFTKYRGGTFLELPSRDHIEKKFFEEHGLATSSDTEKLKFLIDYLGNLGVFHCEAKQASAFIRIEWQQPLMPQKERICELIDSQQRLRRRILQRTKESDSELFFLLKETWPQGVRLGGGDRENWPRHLRVIDAKDQGATHSEIADQFVDDGLAEESTLYKRTGTKATRDTRHKAIVSQWYTQAVEVMEKAAFFL